MLQGLTAFATDLDDFPLAVRSSFHSHCIRTPCGIKAMPQQTGWTFS